MAGLCWMAVMLTVLLSAGDRANSVGRANSVNRVNSVNRANSVNRVNSVNRANSVGRANSVKRANAVNRANSVDLETLASYVYQIKSMYIPKDGKMFSVAVSIPEEEIHPGNTLETILTLSDPASEVKNKYKDDEVYVGKRVVAAKLPTSSDKHVEFLVLEKLQKWFKGENKKDMLLFYVFASPCPGFCLRKDNSRTILNKINIIRQWRRYAVVFSQVFQPKDQPTIPYETRRDALQLLGNHQGPRGQIGLDHVFRCWKPEGSNRMVCISCDNGNPVADECIAGESDTSKKSRSRGGSSSLSVDSEGFTGLKNKGR